MVTLKGRQQGWTRKTDLVRETGCPARTMDYVCSLPEIETAHDAQGRVILSPTAVAAAVARVDAIRLRRSAGPQLEVDGAAYVSLVQTAADLAGRFARPGTRLYRCEFQRCYKTVFSWLRYRGLEHLELPGRRCRYYLPAALHQRLLDQLLYHRAAALSGVSRITIRNWVLAGELSDLRTPGNTSAVSRRELVQLLREKYVTSLIHREAIPVCVLPEAFAERIGFRSPSCVIGAVAAATGLSRHVLKALRTGVGLVPRDVEQCILTWLDDVAAGRPPEIEARYRGVPSADTRSRARELVAEGACRSLGQVAEVLACATGLRAATIERDYLGTRGGAWTPVEVADAMAEVRWGTVHAYAQSDAYAPGEIVDFGNNVLGVVLDVLDSGGAAPARTIVVRRSDMPEPVTMVQNACKHADFDVSFSRRRVVGRPF
jgi:hypothetical protein